MLPLFFAFDPKLRGPAPTASHFQLEATWSLSSGSFGSFVNTGTSKRCFPAIPSCIIKSIEIVVDCPACKVV